MIGKGFKGIGRFFSGKLKNYNSANSDLSRREWLERVSVPAVAATIGLGLINNNAYAKPNIVAAKPDNFGGARIYNIRDFGAKVDGKTLDTKALQAAVDACNHDAGGTVLIPAGTFIIGTVELKSNVHLYIAAQGTLLGTDDGKQYYAADAIPLSGDSTLGDGNVGLFFAV